MNKFKPGDFVVCVQAEDPAIDLQVGKVYEVEKYVDGCVKLVGHKLGVFEHRFELVDPLVEALHKAQKGKS